MSAAPRLYHPDPSEALPEELRRRAKTGDLLLYRGGGGLFGWLTRIAGRTRYTHAGMLICGEDLGERLPEWYVAEMTFGAPGIHTLACEVRQAPGRWEWRPMAPHYRSKFSARLAAQTMRFLTELPYGRCRLIRTALVHLPIVRWFTRPNLSDGSTAIKVRKPQQCGTVTEPKLDIHGLVRRPPYCSAAVSLASRRGGLDPVPGLADEYTEPADLARSLLWEEGLLL